MGAYPDQLDAFSATLIYPVLALIPFVVFLARRGYAGSEETIPRLLCFAPNAYEFAFFNVVVLVSWILLSLGAHYPKRPVGKWAEPTAIGILFGYTFVLRPLINMSTRLFE